MVVSPIRPIKLSLGGVDVRVVPVGVLFLKSQTTFIVNYVCVCGSGVQDPFTVGT